MVNDGSVLKAVQLLRYLQENHGKNQGIAVKCDEQGEIEKVKFVLLTPFNGEDGQGFDFVVTRDLRIKFFKTSEKPK